MNGVKYIEGSNNKKLSGETKLDCTYVSLSTCSSNCPFKNNGCYAELSFTAIHVNKLNQEAKNLPLVQIARQEAYAIDHCYNGGSIPNNTDLRLRVSGDCRTITGTKLINNACGRWKDRGGRNIFSYTHCWDIILREQWNNVSMLASIDSIDQVEFAKQNGYAPALVVSEHKDTKAYYINGSDVKWVPCPAQTKENISCSTCRLCMKADWIFENNMGITFKAHGIKKNSIKKRLKVLESG